jgi:UDP-N-acetylglucosamine pyrophosphorylase
MIADGLQISREEEFSPLKNGPSATQDCPQTCRQMLSDLHKKWILSAEGSFENDAPGTSFPSSLYSYSSFNSFLFLILSISIIRLCA